MEYVFILDLICLEPIAAIVGESSPPLNKNAEFPFRFTYLFWKLLFNNAKNFFLILSMLSLTEFLILN